jgi:hypothetical protein
MREGPGRWGLFLGSPSLQYVLCFLLLFLLLECLLFDKF